MTDDRLDENIEKWSETHPRESVWLQYFECAKSEWCTTNSQRNLKLVEGERSYFLHSQDGPLEEAKKAVTVHDLKNTDVIYMYGVGLGYSYLALKPWLSEDPNHHAVFFEDDPEVIYRLFETESGSHILDDPQVHLFYFNKISDAEHVFNQIYWLFPKSKMLFDALPLYSRTKQAKFDELRHQITYDASVKTGLLDEYLEFGIAFFRNYYPNMLRINEAHLGDTLFGKFENFPAIICGAGPSLQKNIALLKSLNDKAILFAGSSALNALSAQGIKPHFGAGVDPNPMQEVRLKQVKDLNIPFFYRNRLCHEALKLVTGPKLYITGAGGYDVAAWFEEKFGIEGKWVEEGRNVVNFCLEIAFAMGCNPIIFVGMDLSYTDNKAYSPGVVSQNALSISELEASGTIRKDIYGKEVHTEWKWISEAKWIGDFAEAHPEITLFNATEGGMGFPGVQNLTLKEVVEEHLLKPQPIKSQLEPLLQSNSLSRITRKQIVDSFQELAASLEKCTESLEFLNKENEQVKKEIKKSQKTEHTQTGKAALIETELLEEPAFIYILQIFNDVCSKLMTQDIMRLHNPSNKDSEVVKELEKLDLNSERYQFLLKTARINRELILHALKET